MFVRSYAASLAAGSPCVRDHKIFRQVALSFVFVFERVVTPCSQGTRRNLGNKSVALADAQTVPLWKYIFVRLVVCSFVRQSHYKTPLNQSNIITNIYPLVYMYG